MVTVSPYGSWRSPISSDLLAENAVRLSYPMAAGERRDTLYWLESRPAERGRGRHEMRRRPGEDGEEVFGAGFSPERSSTSTGGAATPCMAGPSYFSNFEDQRLYRLSPGRRPSRSPRAAVGEAGRYAARA